MTHIKEKNTRKIYIFHNGSYDEYGVEIVDYLFPHQNCERNKDISRLRTIKHNLHLTDEELIIKSRLILLNEPLLTIDNNISNHESLYQKNEIYLECYMIHYYSDRKPYIDESEVTWFHTERFCEGICEYCGTKVSQILMNYHY